MDQSIDQLGKEVAEGDGVDQHPKNPILASDLPEPESTMEWKDLPHHPPRSEATPKVCLQLFQLVEPLSLLRELWERLFVQSEGSLRAYGSSTGM